jgi:hypothetical protein
MFENMENSKMTHEEMIAKLRTTDTLFNEYLRKYSEFIGKLSAEELALHKRINPPSLPAPFLKLKVKPEDIQHLFAAAPGLVGTAVRAINNGGRSQGVTPNIGNQQGTKSKPAKKATKKKAGKPGKA